MAFKLWEGVWEDTKELAGTVERTPDERRKKAKDIDERINKGGAVGPLAGAVVAVKDNINIKGHHAPPFRPPHAQEDQAVIDEINRLNPDILWVGLGSPKQDYWMQEHRQRLNVPVIIGVGAAFDFRIAVKCFFPTFICDFDGIRQRGVGQGNG